ncbi:MAG: 2-oxoacid:ferredoxin oxidoreductase subunit beta [Leptospiraceae bacterium]|nr:2-oxoacid:ferredoxin oxidoreductase subunit beta [Leptospiraceae bacterium]MDW7975113.1 2-oxoacid:ferredoxin oxidoreductase subunit beta [Leptospiraceae bacterium]
MKTLTKKDYASDLEVRWCPGCGDYAILNAVQKALADLQAPREKTVFISGIGCSSRFPYYMNTYGFHTIHGRAPAIATGLRLVRPDLDIWVITGDGDALSIGGNHFIHVLRRNINMKIILFNNQIYGLTKGQYSPTSKIGTISKTTPEGSIDNPFSPVKLAFGSGATFIARTHDKDIPHMEEVFKLAHQHKGTAFIEVLQNCVIFNDGVYDEITEKQNRIERMIYVEEGKKLLFGKDQEKGLELVNHELRVISAVDEPEKVAIYDPQDDNFILNFIKHENNPNFPVAVGVLYKQNRNRFDEDLENLIQTSRQKKGEPDLHQILYSGEKWEIKD